MKSLKLFPFLFLLAACTGGTPKYDATGTFEATEVIVSAEASGKLLSFDIEEGTTLIDGQEVGIIDTVQLYLKKLQLEASVKSVEGQRPDILKALFEPFTVGTYASKLSERHAPVTPFISARLSTVSTVLIGQQ